MSYDEKLKVNDNMINNLVEKLRQRAEQLGEKTQVDSFLLKPKAIKEVVVVWEMLRKNHLRRNRKIKVPLSSEEDKVVERDNVREAKEIVDEFSELLELKEIEFERDERGGESAILHYRPVDGKVKHHAKNQ